MDNTEAVAKLYMIKKAQYPPQFIDAFDNMSMEETAAALEMEIPTHSQIRGN